MREKCAGAMAQAKDECGVAPPVNIVADMLTAASEVIAAAMQLL